MSKLTEWFSETVKPVHVGVYETDFGGWKGYSRWNGREWSNTRAEVDDAATSDLSGSIQDKRWRGLTMRGGV